MLRRGVWLGAALAALTGLAAAQDAAGVQPKSGTLGEKPANAGADVLAVLTARSFGAGGRTETVYQLKSTDDAIKQRLPALVAKKARVAVTGTEDDKVITVTKIVETFFGTLAEKPADAGAEVLGVIKAMSRPTAQGAAPAEKTYQLKSSDEAVKKQLQELMAKKARVLVSGAEANGVVTVESIREMTFTRPGGGAPRTGGRGPRTGGAPNTGAAEKDAGAGF